MERTAINPWTKDPETATKCWACRKPFTEDDDVKVVDATAPKLVHATEPCRGAMVPLANPKATA